MKISIRFSSVSNILQLSSFLLFFTFSILNLSLYTVYLSNYYRYVILGSILLCLIGEVLKKYRLVTLMGAIVSVIIFVLLASISKNIGELAFPSSFLFIYCLRDVEFGYLAKKMMIVSLIVLSIIIISSKLGIIQDFVTLKAGRERHYLGFTYALFPSTIISNVTVLYAYIYRSRYRFFSILSLFIFNFWIYRQTDSRLTFLTSLLVLLVVIILKYRPHVLNKWKTLLGLSVISFAVSFFISYYLSLNYDSSISWQYTLNNFLGSRLSLGHNSLLQYGFNWTGQEINWIGHALNASGQATSGTYNYVDSMYLQFLQRYGIIFTTLVLMILTATNYRLFKSREYLLLLLMTITAFHGIIDDLIMMVYYNGLLFIVNILMNKDYLGKKDENDKI